MPSPRCARVERKESFPYGARLDRKEYWRLINQDVDVRTPGDQINIGDNEWTDISVGCGGRVWVSFILYRRRVRRE